jgi:hypothetical protein
MSWWYDDRYDYPDDPYEDEAPVCWYCSADYLKGEICEPGCIDMLPEEPQEIPEEDLWNDDDYFDQEEEAA